MSEEPIEEENESTSSSRLAWFLTGAAVGFAAGIKGGVPLNDLISAGQNQQFSFNANTSRYIVGATGELRLPFGLGVELDALYRHFSSAPVTGNAWEFPLLAKYRFPTRIVRPFADAGVAWDTLQGLTQSLSNPTQLRHNSVRGYVIGAGVEIHALVIHLVPEIRYTRWGAQHFLDINGGLSSNQNQAEFLVGITF